MTRHSAFLLTLAWLQSMPVTLHAAQDAEYVTIRATPSVPNSIIEYVAQNSEPSRLKIRANQTIDDFANKLCGAYTNVYRDAFTKLNKDFAAKPLASERFVEMPACLKWRNATRGATGNRIEGVPVKVLPGETLDAVLLRRTGRSGADVFTCPNEDKTWRCNKTLRELVQAYNQGKNLNPPEPDKELILPFVTEATTFRINRVKFSSGLKAQQVVQEINDRAKQAKAENSIVRVNAAPPVRLLGAYPAEDLDPELRSCREAATVAWHPWPYDAQQVSEVIKRTKKFSVEQGYQRNWIGVTVIDTGLDVRKIPEAMLKPRMSGGKRVYGMGISESEQLQPFEDYDARFHGTQVAEILTGGPVLRTLLPELSELFRINAVNVVQAVTQIGAGVYEIRAAGVNEGVNYAVENANVANISIGSEAELKSTLNAIEIRDLLLVVAAGNDTRDISRYPLYPASYGGPGSTIITVAAHDGEGHLAEFSNHSKKYVDIAAPGCAIPYASGPSGELLFGTSFAAPLVSMTAAVLRAFDLSRDQVKLRLQSSVDYDPGLTTVAWSGRLNIVKALSLYEDVVEQHREQRARSELKFFRWNPGTTALELCANEWFDVDKIRKITSLDSPFAPYRIRILAVNGRGEMEEPKECDALGTGLPTPNSAGLPAEIPWVDLVDFVPRWMP